MFNSIDNNINSKHNPTQLHAYNCNNLPYLLSFDIIFHLICIEYSTQLRVVVCIK